MFATRESGLRRLVVGQDAKPRLDCKRIKMARICARPSRGKLGQRVRVFICWAETNEDRAWMKLPGGLVQNSVAYLRPHVPVSDISIDSMGI